MKRIADTRGTNGQRKSEEEVNLNRGRSRSISIRIKIFIRARSRNQTFGLIKLQLGSPLIPDQAGNAKITGWNFFDVTPERGRESDRKIHFVKVWKRYTDYVIICSFDRSLLDAFTQIHISEMFSIKFRDFPRISNLFKGFINGRKFVSFDRNVHRANVS